MIFAVHDTRNAVLIWLAVHYIVKGHFIKIKEIFFKEWKIKDPIAFSVCFLFIHSIIFLAGLIA